MGTISIHIPDDFAETIPTIDPDEESILRALAEGIDISDIAKSVIEQEVGVRDSVEQIFLGWARKQRYFRGTIQRIMILARRAGFLSEGLGYDDTLAGLRDREKQKMRRLRRELVKASIDLEELRGKGIAMLERQCAEMPGQAREAWKERQEGKQQENKAA